MIKRLKEYLLIAYYCFLKKYRKLKPKCFDRIISTIITGVTVDEIELKIQKKIITGRRRRRILKNISNCLVNDCSGVVEN